MATTWSDEFSESIFLSPALKSYDAVEFLLGDCVLLGAWCQVILVWDITSTTFLEVLERG